ncbi:cell division protein ZipA C-terminal FtsZ-binding domain-containing protein [Kaarinaea lacus]
MDPFRLILLAVGIIVLMVVYYLTKRATRKPVGRIKRQIPMSGDVAPTERPYQASFETRKPQKRKRYIKFMGAGVSGSSANQSMYEQASVLEPLSVIVYVMPITGLQFSRDHVIACLETIGCVPRSDGANNKSYDYLILDDEQGKKVNRLFSISDAHQPGIFSRSADAPDKTNGLVFEMELPGPIESVMAFERLLDVARRVATRLNGVVCDDLQNRLTKQATLHIKDKIVDYNRKLQFVHSSSVQ